MSPGNLRREEGATRQEALGRKWLPVVPTGAQIVRRAVEHPLRMLCTNAGVEGVVVVGEVISAQHFP